MNATEKKILELLKEGKSHNAIANELGVPRSAVQRLSDKELGVDPASIKALTTEQILQIQKDSKEGGSNSFLAKVHNVSAKTIARALMVRVIPKANNVTVISPIKEQDSDGDVESAFEVMEGGTAKDGEGNEWYVGKYLENHGYYLTFRCADINGIIGGLFTKDKLTPMETSDDYSGKTNAEVIQRMSEVCVGLTDGAQHIEEGNSVMVRVGEEAELFPLRGSLDARRRVGYYDAVLGRTLRCALSSATFIVKLAATEEDGEEVPVTQTKSSLSGKDLDVFLNEHQILILPESIVIAIDGKPETITTSHQAYEKIVEAIKAQDIKLAYDLMKPREAIGKYSQGLVSIVNNRVNWSGHDITGTSIAKRVLALMLKGDFNNMERLTKFLDKMFANPSAALVQSGKIYEFMAYSDIEIDIDGDIILYKSVRGNYKDKHSGTISNDPGTIVRMARSFVNDNNKDLCSYGLHVCSLAYLKQCFGSMGQRVVRCKLNPKDIVSITNDYGSSKIRCCEYLVLDDYTTQYNRQHKSIDIAGLYK